MGEWCGRGREAGSVSVGWRKVGLACGDEQIRGLHKLRVCERNKCVGMHCRCVHAPCITAAMRHSCHSPPRAHRFIAVRLEGVLQQGVTLSPPGGEQVAHGGDLQCVRV